MRIKNYEGAIRYLEGFIGKIVFKVDKKSLRQHDPLDRMRIFLSLLDNPQNKFKSVLVGGTSGKGSTAYLISHILITAGYKTGFTLSPHLQKVNERLQINGREILDDEFVKLLKVSILPSIERMSKMRVGEPSYFEILIGMAFKYFADQKVDIAVVEVGMGGEFDGTNTLNPLIAVLTNVSLDHTNILGKTIEKIARTKAGIIKKLKIENGKLKNISQLSTFNSQLIVVSGAKQPSVIKIIEKRCKDTGSKLNLLWRNFGYKIKKESLKGSIFDLITSSGSGVQLNDLELSLIGKYQVENASLAIKTILELKKFGFKISDNAIRKALKTAFFPGRFEIVQIARGPVARFLSASAPLTVRAVRHLSSRATPRNYIPHTTYYTLVLDGAHNPTKMKEFLKSLKKLFPKERKVFIIGFKFDKDIKKMLKEILGVADEIIITQFKAKTDTNIHASFDAFKLKSQISRLRQGFGGQAKLKKIVVEKDSERALVLALNYPITQLPNCPTIIVVTGSLYLVGEVRDFLK